MLCGNNGFKAAHEKIDHALTEAAFPYQYRLFHSTCCLENAEELAEEIRKGGFDLVTGVVNGLSKGSNQSAVAHRFYEECRSFFYDETKDFLHGELVALGLLVQFSYTGSDPAPVLRKLEHMKLPVCLSDIGVPLSGAAVFECELCRSSAIRDESDSTRKRMHEALEIIVK